MNILVIRLSAMGDIIHTLPAVATLRQSFPQCQIFWAAEPHWAPLLLGNPCVDQMLPVHRHSIGAILRLRSLLRSQRFDLAVDFQGLIKSSAVALLSGAKQVYGLHRSAAREALAALAYSHTCRPQSQSFIDRQLELAACAGARASVLTFPLPPGAPEGVLPQEPFVLANPEAGWPGKEWPSEYWTELAGELRRAGYPLVINSRTELHIPGTLSHSSGLSGLIWATRKAHAVVGLDSGPLHLAGALGKRGVGIFGPTDPARNGPPGTSLTILRASGAVTSYKRVRAIDPSMRAITPQLVWNAIEPALRRS